MQKMNNYQHYLDQVDKIFQILNFHYQLKVDNKLIIYFISSIIWEHNKKIIVKVIQLKIDFNNNTELFCI